jgi:hypothetical protein
MWPHLMFANPASSKTNALDKWVVVLAIVLNVRNDHAVWQQVSCLYLQVSDFKHVVASMRSPSLAFSALFILEHLGAISGRALNVLMCSCRLS